MAVPESQPYNPVTRRFPFGAYVDVVRWLPSPSPFCKAFVVASYDTLGYSSSVTTYTIANDLEAAVPEIGVSWSPQSRVCSLVSTPSIFAASTMSGSVCFFSAHPAAELTPMATVESEDKKFHVGKIRGVGLRDGGEDCCVTVGEDGRINLVVVNAGKDGVHYRRVFDGNGLVSYTSVKWASGSEFVTGGVGVGIQWWDLRRPDSSVAQLKNIWDDGKRSGIVHSVDIHPSRKHTCLAGGTCGMVLAWDLRWPKQPVIMSEGEEHNSLSHSDVWEVQFTKSSNSNVSSSQILPAMICSEDGILAVLEQGKDSVDLLTEPCAINNFDILWNNPSEVICNFEWESIAILSRPC